MSDIKSLLRNYNSIKSEVPILNRTSTGLPNVDWMLGGGLPCGRFIQAYGPSSAGKTLFALQCAKSISSIGKITLFIDMERTLDKDRLVNLNIPEDLFLYACPITGDEALALIQDACKTEEIGLIILDSIAACFPKSKMDLDTDSYIDKGGIGEQARMFANWWPRIITELTNTSCVVLALNQERTNISTFSYGAAVSLPGGKATTFYSSIIIKIKKGKDSGKADGIVETEYVTTKNKTATVGRKAEVKINPTGLDYVYSLMQTIYEPEFKIIEKRNTRFYFTDQFVSTGLLENLNSDIPKTTEQPLPSKEVFKDLANTEEFKNIILTYMSKGRFNVEIDHLTEKDFELLEE